MMSSTGLDGLAPPSLPALSARPAFRAWWTLALLSLLYVLSLIDRMILALLVAPLKADLGISDVQIGLVVGTAFAIVYGLLGLPLARIADRGNRHLIILAGLAIWSASTIGSAFSTSFEMLVFMRLGLAIGEAALLPATFSMIGDLFPRNRRTLAASIFSAMGSAGAGGAFIIGSVIMDAVDLFRATGWIPAFFADWRLVMVLVGAPGLLLAPLLLLTVREPARGGFAAGQQGQDATSIRLLLAHVRAHARMYTGLLICAFSGTISYAFVAWLPELLRRNFGWATADAGMALGVVLVVSVLGGSLVGPRAADMLVRRGRKDGYLLVPVTSMFMGILAAVLAVAQGRAAALLLIYCFASFFLCMCSNTCLASLQILTPARMRGTLVATYLLVISMAGLGVGPPLTAWLSENFYDGDLALALFTMAPVVGLPIVAVQLWSRPGFVIRMRALDD